MGKILAVKKTSLIILVTFIITAVALPAVAGSLEGLVDQKVTIPGVGNYSLREVFMDITVGSVSYQLPDGGLSSFALASPSLAKGAAIAYFEKERLRAYENQERAMESGSETEREYYRGVIERLEAAKVWITTGDGSQLRAAIAQKNKVKNTIEKEEPSTVDPSTGNISATGIFMGERGVSYKDKIISFILALDSNGVLQCKGTGYIKVLDGSGGWVDFFITLKPGKPDSTYAGKSYKTFPPHYKWRGTATLEIRYGGRSRTEECQWVAEMHGQTITGEVRNFYSKFSNMVSSWIIEMIPNPLQFEANFYNPPDPGG